MQKRHVVGRKRRNVSDARNWRIDDVLAGAYRARLPPPTSLLSHLVGDLPNGDTIVLCGGVKPDSMCNDGCHRPDVLTCPKCIERWNRMHPGVPPPQAPPP